MEKKTYGAEAKTLRELLATDITKARWAFEMQVEAVCAEIMAMSKDFAKALGEVSLDEVNNGLVELFRERLEK